MKRNQPWVSIIVTCYNLGEYLEDALTSAKNQSYKNIEIILVDDGSTEESTIKEVDKWSKDKDIEVLRLKNGGVARARNKGIELSKGEYICSLDADDILDPEYITKAVDIFQKSEKEERIAIVTSWLQRFGESSLPWKIRGFNLEEMLVSNSIHCASVFSRDIYEKVDGYDEKLYGYEDWELWLSILELGYKWATIKEYLFKYRVRKSSKVKASNTKRLDYLSYFMKKHNNLYEKYYKEIVLLLESSRVNAENENINLQSKMKDTKERYDSLKEDHLKLKEEIKEIKNSRFYMLRNAIYVFKKSIKEFIKDIYNGLKILFNSIKFGLDRLLLNKGSVKFLSLDVFDTLLRRDVYPEEVKLATSVYSSMKYGSLLKEKHSPRDLYYKRIQIEDELFKKDGEYKLEEVLEELLKRNLKENKQIENIKLDIINFEMEMESRVLYKDPCIEGLIKKFKFVNKRFFSSDFYMSKELLLELLKPYFSELIDGFVSCDYMKNKSNGELYEVIIESLKTDNHGEVLHIGDNKNSDYRMAKSNGLKALRYFNYDEERKRYVNKKKWDKREEEFAYSKDLDLVLEGIKPGNKLTNEQENLFSLGVKYSPIFYSFVLNIIEEAHKLKIDKVSYFTREGIFFNDIHSMILGNREYLTIKSSILEVSRVATFFPSIKQFNKGNFLRLWSQYKEQSIQSFFKSNGLDINRFKNFIEKYNLDVKKVMQMSEPNNLDKLFDDKQFIREVQKELDLRIEIINKYLKQKGFENELGNKYLIVDIGWRGSIQDNLSYILDKTEIYGKYLGLHSGYYEQPPNIFKSAYGPNYLDDSSKVLDIVNWTGVWEMLTNAPFGSVKGYLDNGSDVIPVLQEKGEENVLYEKYTKYFQMGVLSSIVQMDDFVEKHGINSDELRPYVLKKMAKLVYEPDKVITEAYFSLNHNETFGLGKFINMNENSRLKFSTLLKSLISSQGRRNLYNQSVKTSWRNGFWKHNNINGIMSFFVKIRFLLKGKV